MIIKKINIENIKAAEYNPRKELKPDDSEYQKLKRSIDTFGYVEPIIYNEKSGNIVGGHQRFKILAEQGVKEIDCVVVNLENEDEKILNVLLNKVKGRWDIAQLTDILQELDEIGELDLTGYDDWELQSLLVQYDHIQDLLDTDFSDYGSSDEKTTFQMTFTLPAEAREAVEKYIADNENAKLQLATAVVEKVKGMI